MQSFISPITSNLPLFLEGNTDKGGKKLMNENLELLNCEEFAKLLGIKVNTVYVWLCKKRLPDSIYRKLGRKPIFIKSAVNEWILNGAEMMRD